MLPIQVTTQSAAGNPNALTPKQAAFVEAFVSNGGQKEQAAVEAGFSPRTARIQAYQLIRKPHVLQAILERTALELVCDAPKARARLSQLMDSKSDYVALEATKDVLDRAGLKPVEKHSHQIAGDISVTIDLG